MRTIIVYYSRQGHTRRLLQAISEEEDIELLDITSPEAVQADLNSYDAIGIASGIYCGSFHKSMLSFVQQRLPEYKKVFLIYTYGIRYFSHFYCKRIMNALFDRHSILLGRYCCQGRHPLDCLWFSGCLTRKHPDEQDIRGALAFINSLKKIFIPDGK